MKKSCFILIMLFIANIFVFADTEEQMQNLRDFNVNGIRLGSTIEETRNILGDKLALKQEDAITRESIYSVESENWSMCRLYFVDNKLLKIVISYSYRMFESHAFFETIFAKYGDFKLTTENSKEVVFDKYTSKIKFSTSSDAYFYHILVVDKNYEDIKIKNISEYYSIKANQVNLGF